MVKYILLLFLSANILSQVDEEWVARYNTSTNYSDHGAEIVMDANRNIYSIGSTKYQDDEKWAVIKYAPNGGQIWEVTHNGPFPLGNDEAISAAVSDAEQCIYVTGYERPINAGARNIITIKISLTGQVIWKKIYKYGNDKPCKISVSQLGNIFVAGMTDNSALLIKYNQNGDSLWVKKYNYNNSANTEFIDMEIDALENIYCVSGSSSNIITTKFSGTGSMIWENSYNGTGNGVDEAYASCIDIFGNFYAAGMSKGISTGYDFTVLSYSSTGVLRWDQKLTSQGNHDEAALDVQADGLGNIYATGYIDGGGTGSNYLTVKFDNSGSVVWQNQFNSIHNKWDISECLAIGPDNSVYITGRSGSPPAPYFSDYVTIKYSSAGNMMWFINYDSPVLNGEDIPNSIIVDNLSNVYVTGSSSGTGGSDMCTIKYSQLVGIQPVSSEIPDKFSLSQNYPNPFNPYTKISFDVPYSSFISLKIYDALGRAVSTLVSEQLAAGRYELGWNASSYPSGVYYYKLAANGILETRKMILTK